MNFCYLYLPISGVTVFWPGLIILGFGVGIIGGFFGMGGGWMVTPGLNILGFPMAFAIGTDITHMAGKSLISTMRHSKFGNVDYKMGFIMVTGTVIGFELGAQMVMWFERIGKVDLYVRWIYVVLLICIAWTIFYDVSKKRQRMVAARAAGEETDGLRYGIEWHKTFHRFKIPPIVYFKVSGITCSVWLPVLVSLGTGLLAGLLGIGGGLIRMPALIYFVGLPTHIAVGTDLFEVMISGLYGASTYTYKGRTELLAAIVMLIGASIGAQIGTIATKYIKGYGIRIAFGLSVVGCCVSVIMKLIPMYIRETKAFMDVASTILILTLVSSLSLYIFVKMVVGARREITQKKGKAQGA